MDNGYLVLERMLSIGKNAWIMVILVLERMHG